MTKHRLNRLTDTLEDKGIDVYLATHTTDIRWLTDFAHVFDEEQAHLALVSRTEAKIDQEQEATSALDSSVMNNGRPSRIPTLFTDTRYSEALRRLDTRGQWQILDERRPRVAYVIELLREMSDTRDSTGAFRIGIEADLPLNVYRAFSQGLAEQDCFIGELIEVPGLISQLRAIKDTREIELLKAAQAITDKAFTHMLDYLRPGLTEREVAIELEFFIRRAGAQGVAFPSIVASGSNSAVPHAIPGERVLEQGDFVLMDFGARLDDYCSDMTRTVVLGRASKKQRAMYAAVLEAQTCAIKALAPGMSGLEAHSIAEQVIAKHGFEGKFIHSLGHGVGIDVHELPTLAPKIETTLAAGQVVTVEPGVYLNGIGGVRIEDYGTVTAKGFEDFTQSTHELIEL